MSALIPLNSQRRVIERMNRSMCSESQVSMIHQLEKSKLGVVKKIVTISSMKPEVKKIFIKFLEVGSKAMTPENVERIVAYSKSILDNDKHLKLAQELELLLEPECSHSEVLLQIVKEFVISPLEKSYISKIEKQLRADEALQAEIKGIEADIHEEKMKKLRVYDNEKSGMSFSMARKSPDARKEVQNFENKLMRANQNLNELSSGNDKLRERINQLRKEKNAMEDIYGKLKRELEGKKENVETTIKYAGQAYCLRNQAEEDLRNLKEQAEKRKEQFKDECEKINHEIQHNIRFKQFIKAKQVEREQVQQLEEQIRLNEQSVELKKEQNSRIDAEYQKSVAKEAQIKRAFDRIKKEIGFGDINGEHQGKELLSIFVNLYEKNAIMKKFVEEISREVQELEAQIATKKADIQQMYLKGSADECDREKLNEDLRKRFEYQQKKAHVLEAQHKRSVATIAGIKKSLQTIFEEVGMDAEVTEKLRNCNINEDSLAQFLGELQRKGLEAISQYGKLISEQMRVEKGGSWEVQKQIDELSNIVTLQNMNNMNSCGTAKTSQYPSELLIRLKEDRREEDIEKPLTVQEFKKYAIESLEHFQKKQGPKEKHQTRKYNVAPISSKSKKK